MKDKHIARLLALLLCCGLALSACAPAATEPEASAEATEAPAESEAPAASEEPAAEEQLAAGYILSANDGTYTAPTTGYKGAFKVSITVEGGKVTDIQVEANKETAGYCEEAFEKIPAAIIESQSTLVDVVAGATVTSRAVIEGVEIALGMADARISQDGTLLSTLPKLYTYESLYGLTGEEREQAMTEKNTKALIENAPVRRTLESGVQVQTIPSERFVYNTALLHADQRGCNACHELEQIVQAMPMSHPQLMMTYNVEMTYWNCMPCHISRNPVRNTIHSTHLMSGTFQEMNGSCLSCHQIDGMTGEYKLWDDVKYNVMTGWTDVKNVEGEFTFDQEYLTPVEDIFWYWGNGTNRGYQPNYSSYEEDPDQFDNWEMTITGAVAEPVTLNLKQLAEENSVTKTMKLSCQVNQIGGALCANVEVTGIPLTYIFEKAQINEDANAVMFVGDDLWTGAYTPLDFIYNYGSESLLVYKVNGQYLLPELGYPCQVWYPASGAGGFTKRVKEIRMAAGATTRLMQGVANPEEPGTFFNKPNAAIFYYENGQFFEEGQPITFEGYADAFDLKVAALEFSLDRGATWTRYETPGTDAERWVYWTYTITPPSAGSYVLYVRAVTDTGLVSFRNGTLMFNVE